MAKISQVQDTPVKVDDGDDQTGKPSFDQASIQHGINIATAKHKAQQEALLNELTDLRSYREQIEVEKQDNERLNLEKKQEYQKLLEMNKKKFDEKENNYKNLINEYEQNLKNLVIETNIGKQAVVLKVIPEALDDFISSTSRFISYKKDKAGKFSVFPADEDGNQLADDKGSPIDLKAFLENYLEQRPYFRLPQAQGGSGSKTTRVGIGSYRRTEDVFARGLEKLRANKGK